MLHMQKAALAIFLLSLLSSSSGEPPTLTDEDWGDSIESIDVEGEQKLKMASRGPRYASSNFPEPVEWRDQLKNGVRKNDWTLRQYVNVM